MNKVVKVFAIIGMANLLAGCVIEQVESVDYAPGYSSYSPPAKHHVKKYYSHSHSNYSYQPPRSSYSSTGSTGYHSSSSSGYSSTGSTG